MMVGELTFFAASNVALMVLEVVTFTAGIANLSAFAFSKTFFAWV
jgi:hypothetical protein